MTLRTVRNFVAALALLFLCASVARATDVTVTGLVVTGYAGAGSTATVRVYYSETFVDSLGNTVPGDAVGGPNFYRVVTCPVASRTVTCPSFVLPSTTDSSRPYAKVSLMLYDGTNRIRIKDLFANWSVPPTPATTTLKDLEIFQRSGWKPFGSTYYTAEQVNALNAGRAPSTGSFITRTPDAALTGETALSSLDSGLVYNTTGTGALSSVANGSTGQVLTSNGTGLQPSFKAPAGGDSYVHNVVTEYGASVSAQTATCSITAGQASLICTTAADFQNGQGILIPSAGAGDADFVVNIASGGGTTSLVLASVVPSDASSVTVLHDDTEDVQSAITAAHAAGGGVVFFPKGTYRFNRALNATENSVLTIPRTAYGQPPVTVEFHGEVTSRTGDVVATTQGVIFSTTRITGSGTNPAMISGRALSATGASLTAFSVVTLVFKNIYFRTNANPTISVLQMHNQTSLIVENCMFDTGTDFTAQVEPTTSSSYAIIAPGINNFAMIVLRDVSVLGAFYNGMFVSEHTFFDNVFIARAKRAVVLEDMNIPIKGTLFVTHCPVIFESQNRAYFNNFNLGIERWETGVSGPAQWYSGSATEIFDNGGGAPTGTIHYSLNVGNIGPSTGNITHNLTVRTLDLVKTNAGANHAVSDWVLSSSSPYLYMQKEDRTDVNAIQNVPSAGALDLHTSANAETDGVNWLRADTGNGSVNSYLSPSAREWCLRQTAAGVGTITWSNLICANPTAVTVFPALVASTSLAVGSGGTTLTKVVKGTVSIDPASVAANTFSSQTFPLPGAALGDIVVLIPPAAGLTAGLIHMPAIVSDANQVRVPFYNATGSPVDELGGTWTYILIRS
jgi:hypothetical protein